MMHPDEHSRFLFEQVNQDKEACERPEREDAKYRRRFWIVVNIMLVLFWLAVGAAIVTGFPWQAFAQPFPVLP